MKQVAQALLRASQLNSKLTGNPELTQFTDQIKALGCGIFRLVIMGEIKKGKSSFINALLGVKDLVPTASDVATSTVYKIHYGKEQRYRVFFEKETEKTPLIITSDELADYGSENGNPGNEKRVDFIEVAYPAPLLRSGLVIIDTPGLGGLFKEHKKITWQYVPKADAVFFVTDSVESPIGQEELRHLETVRKITPHLYFIQTKSDQVDQDSYDKRRQNNLQILANAFNVSSEKIPYFVVGSKRKFRADEKSKIGILEKSGYPELVSFVQKQLISNSKQILAAKALQLAAPILQSIRNILTNRTSVLDAETQEKQQQLKQELNTAQKELQEWKSVILPELIKRMKRHFNSILDKATETCSNLRPNGTFQKSIEIKIEQAQTQEELRNITENLHEELCQEVNKCLKFTHTQLEEATSLLIRELTEITRSNVTNKANTSEFSSQDANKLHNGISPITEKKDTLYKTISSGARGVAMGMSIGGSIGSAIPIPVLGTVVGAVIGGAIGWGIDKTLKRDSELAAQKQRIKAEIAKTIATLYLNATDTLKKLTTEASYFFEDQLESSVKQRTEELSKATIEISNRAGISQETLARQRKELMKDTKEFEEILKLLSAKTTSQKRPA